MFQAIPFDVAGLEIGEPSVHHTLTLFPVLGDASGPDYITLREALDRKLITVTEHDDGARVPELVVRNRSYEAVLILDGEILVGAKQNRTLNTTVLLAPRSKTVVPVSCVEGGRWSQSSATLGDLDAVVPHGVRHAKSDSVARSLASGLGFMSDQGRVWSEIEDKLEKHGVDSPSSSMGQLYADKQRELQGYLEAFSRGDRQRGLIAALGGTVVGADILSRPAAYAQVHRRLLKGYAAEDLERRGGTPPVLECHDAREFLEELVAGKQSRNPGVGLGEEFRFAGEGGQGLALVYEDTTIHGMFWRAEAEEQLPDEPEPDEPPIRRRRWFWF